MNTQIDIRNVLATISVPTLVLHRADETWRKGSRYMGRHIPRARMVELPGNDHLPWEGDSRSLLDQTGRFLAGIRGGVEPDRVLATILFADAGHRLLSRHRGLVQADLARFRGHEVDSTDHGISATFDGPARAIRCASAIAEDSRRWDWTFARACTGARSSRWRRPSARDRGRYRKTGRRHGAAG
jgi:hypothetical protein